MEIVRFEGQHIEEARALAFVNYCEERQAVAELLVKKRILYHTIALYEHDTEAIRAWFDNGFGHRCADAIRRVEEIGGIVSAEGITFEEISTQEAFLVRELRRRKRRRKNNCLYGAERQCGEFCDGAYCLPEYRGKNIFQNLLNYVILILSLTPVV